MDRQDPLSGVGEDTRHSSGAAAPDEPLPAPKPSIGEVSVETAAERSPFPQRRLDLIDTAIGSAQH